jgi:hypothetical protein
MPALNNTRQEAFAQLRAQGKTQTEAYELAGYKPSEQHASHLARNRKVKARINEILVESAKYAEVTAESIATELDAAIEFAVKCKQAAAVVSAINSKAKLFGLMADRSVVNVTHNYALMSEEELRFEIAAIHAEARAIKQGIKQ